jgi:redox-sensitive bicupin YhaK (pirin superfamily)
MNQVHATISPGAQLDVPWRSDYNALLYVLNGEGSVGPEQRRIGMGQLAVFGPGDLVTVAASRFQESRNPSLDVLLLGGRPIREPVAWMGPFVMNTREESCGLQRFQAGGSAQSRRARAPEGYQRCALGASA